jgi:hypothetical protein
MPKVSVAMSVYNGEDYLCPAIDSILTQTFNDLNSSSRMTGQPSDQPRSLEAILTSGSSFSHSPTRESRRRSIMPCDSPAENMLHGRILMISRCPSGSPSRSNFSTRTQK